MGETLDYGGGVYGDRDIEKLYSLPTDRNGGGVPLTGTKNPERPECGAQEPQ